jgi:hypothetical protein
LHPYAEVESGKDYPCACSRQQGSKLLDTRLGCELEPGVDSKQAVEVEDLVELRCIASAEALDPVHEVELRLRGGGGRDRRAEAFDPEIEPGLGPVADRLEPGDAEPQGRVLKTADELERNGRQRHSTQLDGLLSISLAPTNSARRFRPRTVEAQRRPQPQATQVGDRRAAGEANLGKAGRPRGSNFSARARRQGGHTADLRAQTSLDHRAPPQVRLHTLLSTLATEPLP